MSLAEIVILGLKISIFAIVLAIGMRARPGDLMCVMRTPGRLARSLVAMVVVMPLLAVLLVTTFDLPRPVGVMLIALALAPVPPILPGKQSKAGGDAMYAVGLLAAVALIAIIVIPLELELIELAFGMDLGVPPERIASLAATSILIPLIVGAAAARLAPSLALRLSSLFSKIGGVLLLAATAAILATQWRAMLELVGDGTLLAMAIFVVVGLVAGHLLGGPDPNDRTVLALATASRHPGIALLIAQINYPQETALAAAVLIFLVTNAVLTAPYVFWRKRIGAGGDLSMPA
jgi:bile acid:Na+ symporter, BASS family